MRTVGRLICIVISTLLLATACNFFPSFGGETLIDLADGEILFYSTAKEAAPEILDAVTSQSRADDSVTPQETEEFPLKPIYILLQEFDPEKADSGDGPDNRNLYRTLYDAGNDIRTTLPPLEAPVEVASPYDFGSTARTYTHGEKIDSAVGDSQREYLMAVEGDTLYSLMSYHIDESSQDSYGVIESQYNQSTGDIVLRLVHLVDYGDSHPDTEKYVVRMYLEGNENEHRFTVRAINPHKFNDSATWKTGEYYLPYNLVGTGVSESDSGEDYFLLKVQIDDVAGGETRYFKIASDNTTKAALTDYVPQDGYTASEIEQIDPKGYLSTLNETQFYEASTEDTVEAPMGLDDFVNGSISLNF